MSTTSGKELQPAPQNSETTQIVDVVLRIVNRDSLEENTIFILNPINVFRFDDIPLCLFVSCIEDRCVAR